MNCSDLISYEKASRTVVQWQQIEWRDKPFGHLFQGHAGFGLSGQVLQFLPVIYGPGVDEIRALPLISGDSSGAATAINDRGQAVGISGSCDQAVGRYTAAHAVLNAPNSFVAASRLSSDAYATVRP